jgi:ABC-type transporter Mla subunit MlaD
VDTQTWIAIFVGITAFSFFLQSLAIFGIYSRLKQVSSRVDDISGDVRRKLSDVTAKVQQTLDAAKPIVEGVERINENLLSVSMLVKNRAVDFDRVAQEATATLRMQLARLDGAVDHATNRIQNVVDTWHRGVIAPVHELSALVKGVRAGFEFFFSRKESRPGSGGRHTDDELFI